MDTTENSIQATTEIGGQAGTLHVDDGGTAGLPVVLVHSFGGSSEHWRPQLEHLRKHRRALALDFRGHGQSESPKENDFRVSSLSDDIAAVVDSLRLDRFILVGHSMGGSAAIEYAAKNPGRVAGLLLAGTPGKTPAEQSKPIMTSLESNQYDKVMNDYMRRLLQNAKPAVDSQVMKGMRQLTKGESLAIIGSVFEYDPLPALKKYKGPVLIVDIKTQEQPNALSAQLPKLSRSVIEGTSHWMQLDKPDEFNRILDNFISTVEKSSN